MEGNLQKLAGGTLGAGRGAGSLYRPASDSWVAPPRSLYLIEISIPYCWILIYCLFFILLSYNASQMQPPSLHSSPALSLHLPSHPNPLPLCLPSEKSRLPSDVT